MTLHDLTVIKKHLADLRWMQAVALVSLDLGQAKKAKDYMLELNRLEKVLADEIAVMMGVQA